MLTPNEYRLMAEECLLWARQARSDDVRDPLIELARIWTEAASKLDGSAPMYPRTGLPPKTIARELKNGNRA
jgi:hypothetical protein